ncbi:membrane fusion protein, Cu(I)/Ag(I) efflux system [Rhizobium mongolense subsp. loessense]|uniref:Membrane fusion protein, Cu(I)/Ag(I) efflux system n=1 Tax=Rhizobium mongolense subsp. loessense TaxID=158890 RepID=A0A1G4U2N2_9HYPH|nr:efflux RND transporter periplasmic adaptor subunit [Rhizobium mongolense]SCW87861.1 membrane fusion protein, Cu(I)/Ag(I) efflux system [Rhizobium mongolense subsp. loessense]
MKSAAWLAAVTSLAVVGVGAYLAGAQGVGQQQLHMLFDMSVAEAQPSKPEPTGAVIYYRHPDGLPEYSAKPKKTSDGRDFVSVRESEDISFTASGIKTAETSTQPKTSATGSAATERRILYYRNPMGLPDTSKVPKKDSMGMNYIPVFEGDQADASTVKVSLGKLQRTGVKTTKAELASISRKIRVPGTVVLDERLISVISMRTDAFIDHVANVTTGDRIGKGESLFSFYSKEIATAGAEFAAGKGDLRISDAGSALRLKNLGVPDEVIRSIAEKHQVPTSIEYVSPRNGVILERMATTGMMAKPGDPLFRIADTSYVWVNADVPEFDLASIQKGAPVAVTLRSLPGRTFEGTVDLIYPEIQQETRTTKVRIELPNLDGILMANMYADVEIEAGVQKPVVVVPNSAVIDTGNRQVVFIDKGDGKFEPKDVSLGARGEEQTEITKGIAAGDEVVVAANFLLDAESNLNSALSGMAIDEVKP